MKLTAPIDRLKEKSLQLPVLLIAAMLFSLLPFAAGAGHPVSGSGRCVPAFPDRDGWYGGDGAYSILVG